MVAEFEACGTCRLTDWPERMLARDGVFFCSPGCSHAYLYDHAEWRARFLAEQGLALARAGVVQFGRARITARDFEQFRALHVQLTQLGAYYLPCARTALRLRHYLSELWEYHCGSPGAVGALPVTQ